VVELARFAKAHIKIERIICVIFVDLSNFAKNPTVIFLQ
jgi:hypothetical protein